MVDSLSMEELSRRSGVSVRQIRALMASDVVPRSGRLGRGATYEREHLARLRAWKVLAEKAPPKTTNAQIKTILDRLALPVLEGIADGSIPFALEDDGRTDVQVAVASRRRGAKDAARPAANPEALAYLKSLAPARVKADLGRSKRRFPIDMSLAAAAGPNTEPLRRLHRAVEEWSRSGTRVGRSSPVDAEVWHVVSAGDDLRIHARGPLGAAELELLRAVAQALVTPLQRKDDLS